MEVLEKARTVVAIGEYEGQVFRCDIKLTEGTEAEQREQIFQAITDYSERLEMEMSSEFNPLFIDWVVNG